MRIYDFVAERSFSLSEYLKNGYFEDGTDRTIKEKLYILLDEMLDDDFITSSDVILTGLTRKEILNLCNRLESDILRKSEERKQNILYRDNETGDIITLAQLEKEYNRSEVKSEYSCFADYLQCSLTSENGTLERIY